jgi:hypothetical protein
MAECEMNRPTKEANKTGKERPVPINIAPAISSDIRFRLQKTVIEGTQYSSQIKAKPQNMAIIPRINGTKPLEISLRLIETYFMNTYPAETHSGVSAIP